MPRLNLTPRQLEDLCVAVDLRAEACEDNKETRDARRWRKLLEKLQEAQS